MNKNIILTIVVVGLFGVSGMVLYYGIFNKPSSSNLPIEANQKSIVNLLPYGEELNFDVLENRPNVSEPFVYKKVNPAQDVGVGTRDMIKNTAPDVTNSAPNQIF